MTVFINWPHATNMATDMKSHVKNLFNVPTNIQNNKPVLFDVKAPFHDQCEMIRKQFSRSAINYAIA